MNLQLTALTALQQDLLHALANVGTLRRTRGGYVGVPGSKPFTVRTVLALQRMGVVTLSQGTACVNLTAVGSHLLAHGEVLLSEEQAG